MTSHVATLVNRLRAVESELHQDLIDQAGRWRFEHQRRSVHFSPEVRDAQRQHKPTLIAFLKGARPLPILTAPVIYSVGLPFLVLDLWMTLFQHVCFRVYGIPRVRRGDYFAIDRHKLAYLNGLEKFHCFYCSYANGLLAYVREIVGRTEQYWCPIKHARPVPGTHDRYHLFTEYGDAAGYRRDLPALRRSFYGPREEDPTDDR